MHGGYVGEVHGGAVMREILFKAKRTGRDEWVEGHLVGIDEETWFIASEDDIFESYTDDRGTYDGYMTVIDPATICQYTGLTDKNGNKIWENDILIARDPYIQTVNFSIRYYQKSISYIGLYDEFGKAFELNENLLTCSEVIGNIFDNPELLKAGD